MLINKRLHFIDYTKHQAFDVHILSLTLIVYHNTFIEQAIYKHQLINIYKRSTGMTIHSDIHCDVHYVRNPSCRIERGVW